MKKGKLLMAAGVLLLILTACGGIGDFGSVFSKKNFDVTTVVIGKKQAVSEYVVEDFDKDYYNADELKQSIQQAVDAYNASVGNEDAVSLKSFDADEEEKKVKVHISYQTAKDYKTIHRTEFFVGTVSDAKKAGYEIENLHAPEAESASNPPAVSALSDEMAVICMEEVDVSVPGDVLYVSDSATLQSEGLVRIGASDTYSVIIYQ